MKVLLIEDELKIASYVTKALTGAGHTVTAIADGNAGFARATSDPFDVIILDLGLPGCDGLEILGGIRERSISTPVLILTARGDVKDRIEGLNRGADDYLAKPFSMEELLARVHVLTRRKGEDASPLLRVGDLVMNETTHLVTRGGKTVHLSQREYEVLHFLMLHAGRHISRTEICEHVWKSALANDTNAVDVYIQRLRTKVDAESDGKLIQTVRGVGYVMGSVGRMKKLPLTAKVALWSFVLAGVTLGSALYVMTNVLERELVSTISQRLERTANDIFAELDHRSDGPAEKLTSITKQMMPRSVGGLPVEIVGPDGNLLYRSPSLKERTLRGGPATPHETVIGKLPFLVETYEQRGLTVLIGFSLKPTQVSLDRVKTASLVALPVAALLSLLGGYWVAGRALMPVRKITEAAARISANDLHQRLPVPVARDEIRLLTKVLNATFERLERSYLQAVRFASDASHQLKTPVTVMRAAIEDLLRDASLGPEQTAVLNDLLDQTRRLSSLTEGLLLLARADAGGIQTQPDETDLIPILDRCIEDAEVLGSNQEIRIEREIPAKLRALADPGRTEQILLNLLENAVKYNRRGGVIRVRAGERRDGVFITVSNTGDQIPLERMPWIFDRFARGDRDESRAGHGLGLSIARELASAQGGDVRLLRSDVEGTEFELRLASVDSKATGNPLMPLMTPPPSPAALLRIPG